MEGVLYDQQGQAYVYAPEQGDYVPYSPGGFINNAQLETEALMIGGKSLLGQASPEEMGRLSEIRQEQSQMRPGLGQEVGAIVPGAVIGTAGALAGTAAAPAVGLGALTGAMIGGGLADAAVGAATTPETPWQGAAIGAAAGAALPAAAIATRAGGRLAASGIRGAGSIARRVAGQIDDAYTGTVGARISREAAEAAGRQGDGAMGASSPRVFEGAPTSSRMASEGFPMTEVDARWLDATRANFDELDQARVMQEVARSDLVQDFMRGRVNDVRAAQDDWVTERIAQEMGLASGERLTPQTMRNLQADLGRQFDEVQAKADPQKIAAQAADIIQNAEQAKFMADNPGTMAQVDHYTQRLINAFEAETAPDQAQRLMQMRSELGSEIRRAAGAGQYERAMALGEIQDGIDEAIGNALPEAAQKALSKARERYRVYKAVERSSPSLGLDGNINAKSFLNSLQRQGNRFGKSMSKGQQQFFDDITAAAQIMERPVPTSGTSERLMANTSRLVAGGAMGALGLGALN